MPPVYQFRDEIERTYLFERRRGLGNIHVDRWRRGRPVRYQSALTRYKTTPCGGTTALMSPLVFFVSPVHRLSVE